MSVVRVAVPNCGRVSKGLSCGTEIDSHLLLAWARSSWARIAAKQPFFCVELARCVYDTGPFASISSLRKQLVSGCLRKRNASSPMSITFPSYNGMRWTGQEVILRLTTVPAGYTGGNAFRHWSHVINQLWKQQISCTPIYSTLTFREHIHVHNTSIYITHPLP